jgi:hypothetical protein
VWLAALLHWLFGAVLFFARELAAWPQMFQPLCWYWPGLTVRQAASARARSQACTLLDYGMVRRCL